MTESFITYKVFTEPELAKDFAEILEQHNIRFALEEDTSNLPASFGNHPLNRDCRLKLRQSDFITANLILEVIFKQRVATIERDYFLYDFTDEELFEILTKPDEWGELNYQIAQKLLKDRGKEFTIEQLEIFKKQRLEELSKPEKTDYTTIVLGYIFTLFFPAALFLGYLLAYSKKTLPNGLKVYAYSKKQRFHGKAIIIISSLLLLLVLVNLFVTKDNY